MLRLRDGRTDQQRSLCRAARHCSNTLLSVPQGEPLRPLCSAISAFSAAPFAALRSPTCRLGLCHADTTFSILQVDLFRECPFWQEDGSCMNRACSVETTEEVSGARRSLPLVMSLTWDPRSCVQEHIPEAWRSQALGKLKPTRATPVSSLLLGLELGAHDLAFCTDQRAIRRRMRHQRQRLLRSRG